MLKFRKLQYLMVPNFTYSGKSENLPNPYLYHNEMLYLIIYNKITRRPSKVASIQNKNTSQIFLKSGVRGVFKRPERQRIHKMNATLGIFQ